jgi:hypothetical protein
MNPGEPIFDPRVISGSHNCRLVEAANGDINLICIRFRQEGQWRAALRTERTQTPRPFYFAWVSGRETKAVSTERCPGYERSATAPAAVYTMAMCDIVRLAGRLVTHRTAQTTATNDVCIHRVTIDDRLSAGPQQRRYLHNRNLPEVVLTRLDRLR